MKRILIWYIPLVAAVLSGCVQQAPSSSGHNVIDQQKRRWLECSVASYKSTRAAGVEKNLAAEQSFIACGTEERAMLSHFQGDQELYYPAVRLIDNMKATLKTQMVQSTL